MPQYVFHKVGLPCSDCHGGRTAHLVVFIACQIYAFEVSIDLSGLGLGFDDFSFDDPDPGHLESSDFDKDVTCFLQQIGIGLGFGYDFLARDDGMEYAAVVHSKILLLSFCRKSGQL